MARLVLVGLPGVGKSTIAHALAAYWGCDAIDTDDVIAEMVGAPTAQYLAEKGEVAFRSVELDALRSSLARDAIVATGAGVVTTSAARELLKAESTLWLDGGLDTLVVRVSDGERPLLGSDHRTALVRLRGEREDWYRSVARARVDADGAPAEVLARVLDGIEEMAP